MEKAAKLVAELIAKERFIGEAILRHDQQTLEDHFAEGFAVNNVCSSTKQSGLPAGSFK
jgi:hypothetical protein